MDNTTSATLFFINKKYPQNQYKKYEIKSSKNNILCHILFNRFKNIVKLADCNYIDKNVIRFICSYCAAILNAKLISINILPMYYNKDIGIKLVNILIASGFKPVKKSKHKMIKYLQIKDNRIPLSDLVIQKNISYNHHDYNYNINNNINSLDNVRHNNEKKKTIIHDNDELQLNVEENNKIPHFIVFSNIKYSINYRGAPNGEEINPKLHFYLSSDTSKDVFIHHIEDNIDGKSTGTLDLKFKINPNTIHNTIWNCKLNIDLFDEIQNKYDDFCTNQAGSTMLSLPYIMNILRNNNHASIELKLVVPVMGNSLSKGEIKIFFGKSHANIYFKGDQFKVNLIEENINKGILLTKKNGMLSKTMKHKNVLDHEILKYIDSTHKTFEIIKPTWDAISKIHTFVFSSRVGNMPSCFYQYLPISKEDKVTLYSIKTWKNLIQIALDRDNNGISYKDFCKAKFPNNWETFEQYASRIMAICLTIYANACKYITDKININDRTIMSTMNRNYIARNEELIESFDRMSIRYAGDCEDDSWMMMYQSFVLYKFKKYFKNNVPSEDDMALVHLSNIRSQYYVFANLCGTSSMTVSGKYGRSASITAHEYLILIPRNYYNKMLNNYMVNPLNIMNEYSNIKSDMRYNVYRPHKDSNKNDNLKVLVCEGTGYLDPEPVDRDRTSNFSMKNKEDHREIINNIGNSKRWVITDLKKKHAYFTDGSPFYKTNTSLFTHEFYYRGINVGEFVSLNTSSDKNYNWTYGTKFTSIINKDNIIGLLPQPHITDILFKELKSMSTDLHHVHPLYFPKDDISDEIINNFIKTIKDTVGINSTRYKELINSTEYVNDALKVIFAEYYMRSDQFNEQRTNYLIKICKKIGPYCWIDIKEENICFNEYNNSNFTNYRIIINIPNKVLST